ncbi:MAG: hypothetical protein JWO58_2121 [Chitinophagaceae bacterium]|nr:hypothetical protein [Chitinophagaceae bacterium]
MVLLKNMEQLFLKQRYGVVGVHEKSEWMKALSAINFVSYKGTTNAFIHWFSWRPFLLFLLFWASKRKERGLCEE